MSRAVFSGVSTGEGPVRELVRLDTYRHVYALGNPTLRLAADTQVSSLRPRSLTSPSVARSCCGDLGPLAATPEAKASGVHVRPFGSLRLKTLGTASP